MKRFKRLLSVLLVLALTFGLIPLLPGGRTEVLAAEKFPSNPLPHTENWGDFTWTIDVDEDAEWDLSEDDGKPCKLTIAGSGAMSDINISNSVIPWEAYASFITSVSIPEGVTKIGNGNFVSCVSLQSVTIPDSVTSIGKHAFYNLNFVK